MPVLVTGFLFFAPAIKPSAAAAADQERERLRLRLRRPMRPSNVEKYPHFPANGRQREYNPVIARIPGVSD